MLEGILALINWKEILGLLRRDFGIVLVGFWGLI